MSLRRPRLRPGRPRRRARALVALALGGVALGGCRFGPASSVLDGANVEIVVAGTADGDPVHVDFGGEVRDAVAGNANPLVVYLTLDVGEHRGSLSVGAGDAAVCAALDGDVGDGVTVLAFDARQLPRCAAPDAGEPDAGEPDAGEPDAGEPDAGEPDAGEPDAGEPDAGEPDAGEPDAGEPDAGVDTGTFVAMSETVNDAVCVDLPCRVLTTVSSLGTVTVVDHANPATSGDIDGADLLATALQVTGSDADTLFAGDDPLCPQILANLAGLVILERTVEDPPGSDTTRTDTVDVSLCTTGIAHTLRARLELLRSLL